MFYKVVLQDGKVFEGTCRSMRRIIEMHSTKLHPIKEARFKDEAFDEKYDTIELQALKEMTQKELILFHKKLKES